MKSLAIKLLLSFLVWQSIGSTITSGQNIFRIKGNLKISNNQRVVIQYVQEGILRRDTIITTNGLFNHSMIRADGDMASVLSDSYDEFIFWLEPPLILLTGELDSFTSLSCSSTIENAVLETYRRTVEIPYTYKKKKILNDVKYLATVQKQENEATCQFIERYSKNRTAAYLLYSQVIQDTTDYITLERLFYNLSPAVKADYWAQRAKTRMFNFYNRPRVGKKLLNFNLVNASGKSVSLDSFKGKYLLIDFWGTWCAPCIKAIPELKYIYTKYKDQFNMISIAKERPKDRQKWINTIVKYDLTWPQTAEFTSSKNSIFELYNVVQFPTILIVDSNGVLITQVNYGEPLEEKIQKIINTR